METKRKYTKPKYNAGWFNGKQKSGVENPNWKGDKATHSSLHCWIRDNFKPEPFCEICKRPNDGSTIFDWSNKDHTYNRIRSEWQHICRGCHTRYDIKNNGRKPYKKIWLFEWSPSYERCVSCGRNDVKHKCSGKCAKCYLNENR